jgi:hypothetical protein
MCEVSDKIKFCTCAEAENIEELDSYWVLHKFNPGNDDFLIGMLEPPTAFRDPNFELNQNVILDRLNDGEAFDKPLEFEKKDRLEVVIKLGKEQFFYYFQYRGRKWKAVKEDPFELESNYDFKRGGRVKY